MMKLDAKKLLSAPLFGGEVEPSPADDDELVVWQGEGGFRKDASQT